jgi:hypothetical protein
MKAFISTALTLSLLAAFIPVLAQNKTAAKDDLYSVCATAMEKTPLNAVVPCKQYLEQEPYDDATRVGRVTK